MEYTENLTSKSGKGISILVEEASSTPRAIIIETHGGFMAKKEQVADDNKPLIEFLKKEKINYVAIDLSNNGTQQRQPFDELRFGDRIEDVHSVIDYVLKRYGSDIILLGSSLGGMITLNAGIYSPSIKGVVLSCAALKAHECISRSMTTTEFSDWKRNNMANVWGVPMEYDFYQDLVNNDASRVIGKITVPILWFHGTGDEVVPIEQAKEALKLNQVIRLVEIPGGRHRFGDKMKPGEWEKKVEEFIIEIVGSAK